MLIALWPTSEQFNDNNGSILTNGKIYVYYSGRAALAPTWSSADGSHVNSNPIILDNNGRAVAFADDQYTYTCVVCDFYGREMFSFDPASYGTGGGGSSGEGGPAQHWIGKSASSVSVPKLTATTLPLPSNPDYEGDFATIIDNSFVLAPGLYMVDCLVDFRQSSSDLTNSIGSIKFYTSDSSDPIEGQIFERNETGPDASGASHQVQVSFVRHVAEVDDDDALRFEMTSSNDLTYARIDRLSIVKLEQGGGGTAYAAGYGIQIDGQVISTSGMMPESSAANFVNVETYNTDIQNIYETIAETSAMIPSGVATEQWVTDYTSAFITEDALDGYATQSWVEDQHYITSADLPESVPLVAGEGISIVDTSASTIISVDSAYTPGVSEEWVEEYVSDATSGFITSADIPDIPEDVVTSGELASTSAALESMIPSLDGYATEQFVEDYTSAFLTSADVPHLTQEQADWDEDDPTAPDYIKNKPSIPSIEGLASEQYVQDYTSAFITESDIPADLVTSGELATVSGEIVNQIPDTSDMATKTWVGEQGYITSLPEDLVTSGELATVSGDIMSQIPSPTTVSIDPTLSSGTKIADFNINGTSGELFAPAGGGGGSVTFPLEVSGVTRVYEAVDTSYSAYLNSHAFGIEYHAPAGGEPEDTVTTIVPGIIFTSTYDGNSNKSLSVLYDRIELDDDDPDYGGHSILDRTSIDNWNDTYNAINASATYWNSSIFSDQITSAALVNSLPADASAHPNYLYLIPES